MLGIATDLEDAMAEQLSGVRALFTKSVVVREPLPPRAA